MDSAQGMRSFAAYLMMTAFALALFGFAPADSLGDTRGRGPREKLSDWEKTQRVALAFGVAAVPFVVVIWIIARRARFRCQVCNTSVKSVGDLEATERDRVLSYFVRREGREAEKKAVYVCTECGRVYDDFSGERQSREQDRYYHISFCKACGQLMHVAGADSPSVACNHCGVDHKWEKDDASGYTFLAPPEGTDVLKKCLDYSMGGA